MHCLKTGLVDGRLSLSSLARRVALWICFAPLIAALPAVAGMPARDGVTYSLVNPPGAKAVPLPHKMDELVIIDAPTLWANCVEEWPEVPDDLPEWTLLCDQVVGGADHQVAATSGRLKTEATLVVGSVPFGSVPVAAWLYWSLLRDPAGSLGETLVFDGVELHGELVGVAQQPCWDISTEVAGYRASVIDQLVPGINGEYTLSGIPIAEGVTPGINPWDPEGDVPPYFEGAAIVVVYLNASVPWHSMVAVHEKVLSLREELTIRHPLSMAVPRPTDHLMRFSRIAADGQTSRGAEATVALNTWLGPMAEVLIRGSESEYDRGSDFSGGRSNRELMDAESSQVPMGEVLVDLVGKSQYTVRYDLDLDFLAPPCAAVPPSAIVPEGLKAVGEPLLPVDVLVDCITVLAHVITVR